MNSKPRIAFVLDALPAIGGGEKTLFAALEAFPQADLFTLIYNKKEFAASPIAHKKVVTSYLDGLPFAQSQHRLFLPLMPAAIERFDLCQYDTVVAFSYAVAHGVRVKNGARHLSYVYTPMRYAWSDLNLDGSHSQKNPLLDLAMQKFRAWDRSAAARVHEFAAISHGIASRLRSAYQREAQIIYPPVETERFTAKRKRKDYFITVSRLVPHKRLDVIIDAFSRLNLPLKVIGEGSVKKSLQKRAAPNIEFLGFQTEETVARLLEQARGFISAAEEDFGIAIVEAQAAGCPVIAYKGGGALETVVDGETGLFFEAQSAGSLSQAIQTFQDSVHCFHMDAMVENAHRFSKARFLKSFRAFVA